LREKLLEEDYEVLESTTNHYGVPEIIIIGGGHGMNHKQDFYKLAKGLPFSSGECYISQELRMGTGTIPKKL